MSFKYQVYNVNQIILDNNYVRVTYVGLVKQGNFWEIRLFIENKSDKPLTLKCKNICMGDFYLSEYSGIVQDLPGLHKTFKHASMMFSELEDLGIEDIKDMYDIEFSLVCEIDLEIVAESLPLRVKAMKYISKNSNMKKLNEILNGIETKVKKVRNNNQNTTIDKEDKNIFENEFFKLICKGIICVDKQWKIKFIVENKSRSKIAVGVNKVVVDNQIVGGFSYIAFDVNPEQKIYKDFYFNIDDLEIEKIEDIQNINFFLFYEFNGIKSIENPRITIYPVDYLKEIYQEMDEILDKIDKGVVWDEFDRNCQPKIEFEFVYPNGKHGDIDMHLISQEGEYKRVSPISFKANLSPKKLYIIELMVLFYYIKFHQNSLLVNRNNNEEAIKFLYKYNSIMKLNNLYDIVDKETKVTNSFEMKIKERTLEILKKKYKELLDIRNKIYNEIVADGKTNAQWKSEQQLYIIVKEQYNDAIYQYTAEWLGKQSLDIYIPSINVAIEYQGRQHYEPVEIFDGENGFKQQQARDLKKKNLCMKNGVKLIEWKYNVLPNLENLEKIMGNVTVN
ncbi:hypothetical protein PO869_01815 [[Ruminococcus] gnavus]|uniref:Uncharacterized protein n=1 Tax=Mediterraneibacter gnavus TaxID=33038 RepID=A0AAW6JW08_MEDGN|nr:hypothetical protein [Mediterraneibacter gnavus]MDC6138758.1 hypothetical protein [Mediterraneibacter gnavus]MDE1202324.1 hypothetical protein [Mediterraneibacter gnavus]